MDNNAYLLSRTQHVELAIWFHNIVWDTAGNKSETPTPKENAENSAEKLSEFIEEVDTAIQRDYSNAGQECAVDTLFDESHPLSYFNEQIIKRWIAQSGQPLQGAVAEPDGEYFLDFLLAVDVSGDTMQYEATAKRLKFEMCPPLPLDTAEARAEQYATCRMATFEEALGQRTLYRQPPMVEAYEVQSRANIFSELEVLKFRTWAVTHSSVMTASRREVSQIPVQ